MKTVKKTEFQTWQKYEFEHTFMFQGFLLLASSLLSCSLFALAVYIFVNYGDFVFDSYIKNGDIIASIVGPIFWSAVSSAGIILTLTVLSDLMTFLFRKWTSFSNEDALEAASMPAEKIRRILKRKMVIRYLFYIFIYLLWLYSSVIFSFVFLNGMVKYSVILISLTFLTYFGKKILCFPIYTLMKGQQDREKTVRRDRYLSLKTNEGGRKIDAVSEDISYEKYPVLREIIDTVSKEMQINIFEAKAVLGDKITVGISYGKRYSLTIGAGALSVLSEKELREKIRFEFMRAKNPGIDTVNRFLSLQKSVLFSASSWNPLERVYKPFDVYMASELRLLRYYVYAADQNVYLDFSEKFGEESEVYKDAANVKLWIYRTHPIAADAKFHAYLYSSENAPTNYVTKVSERFFEYVRNNKENIKRIICESSGTPMSFFPHEPKLLISALNAGKISLDSRPIGDYGLEIRKIEDKFDRSFSLCMGFSHSERRNRLFLEPKERITAFENERMQGKDKTDEEILSVVSDYLTLRMPKDALGLSLEVKDEKSPKVLFLKGMASVSEGDKSGIDLIIQAGETDPKYVFASDFMLGRRMPLILTKDEQIGKRKKISEIMIEYSQNRVPVKKLWVLDEISGEYKLVSECKPAKLTKEEKEKIKEKIISLCRDRLEWAAVVSYEKENKKRKLLVVCCEKLTFGRYTDSFIEGVYSDDKDLVARNVRILGDFGEICDFAEFYPDAPVEAFEAIEGAIICRRGKLEAEKYLKDEAKRHSAEMHDGDFQGFEQEETEE